MSYCDIAYADTYISAGAFASKWAGENTLKQKFLEQATRFIKEYSWFTDESGDVFRYDETAEGAVIPEWLKQATCEEALYLITLGKDPTAADKKLTLGIKSTDGTVFDKEFQADILCPACIRLIESNGGMIEGGAVSGNGVSWSYFNK